MTYISTDYPAEFLSLFGQIAEPGDSSACWLWPHVTDPGGYGKFSALSLVGFVHRISHHVYNGPIPAGLVARHHCDVRSCWNPTHLTFGTHAENRNDAVIRDRTLHGMEHPGRIITADDARAIFCSYHHDRVRLVDLAERYGLSVSGVYAIADRTIWGKETAGIKVPTVRLRPTLLSDEQVTALKVRRTEGAKYVTLAGEFGVSEAVAWNAVHKR